MMQLPLNPLFLVDGFSYLYRAYYAFPTLVNYTGKPTGAIYGVINMLYNFIMKHQPKYIAVVFDAQGKTFRNTIFKHYKSNRLPMPKNLQVQIQPLYAILRAMGLNIIIVPDVEADDVIGTLAVQTARVGHPVLINADDKDMAQLITQDIILINIMSNIILGPKEIMMKYGVPPNLIIDLFALTGDYIDNIPGVPGIGKKTAQVLLRTFGGLDNIYTQLEKIPNMQLRGAKTIAQTLSQNRKLAYLSYSLATIKTDIKLHWTYKQLTIQQPMTKDLLNLFKKYEFNNLIIKMKARSWI